MVSLIMPAATALLLTCPSTSVAASNKAIHESKIEHALSYHATNSQQLLERSIEEGGATAGIVVGPDGTISTDNVREKLWKAEFSLQALEEDLTRLTMANDGARGDDAVNDNDNDSDDGENDYEDSSDDDYEEKSKDRNSSSDDGDDDDDFSELSPDDKAVLKPIKDPRYRNIVYRNLMNEADIRAELKHHTYSWDELTYWELHAYFACHRVMAGNRPVYDSERWRHLREFYNEFVARDLKEDPATEDEPQRTYKFSEDSFNAPTDPFGADDVSDSAEEDEEKGRGLKAARDIGKGELVFKATNNTVVFNDGHTWSSFLLGIYQRHGEPYDSETTCDFMVWSWIQRLEEDGPSVIVADMDNGSLLNEGRFDDGEYDPPNVRCGKEGDKICMMSYYALKDIKKGEELLCNYADFALIWSWKEMGL